LSASGAYRGEMGSVTQFDKDNEVAGFLDDVRATYMSDPEEAVASRHLAAIAHEAQLVLVRRTPTRSWRRTMIRNRLIRPVAALGAAMLPAILGTAGLAVAGVNLPAPATEAFENVGISLPNQAGGESGEHARSDDVRSVIEQWPTSERGCAFGHAVAGAAGASLPAQAQDACGNEDAAAAHRKNGNAAKSDSSSHSEFGRETAERAKGLGDATPEQRRDFGGDTSDQATQLGGAPDQTPAVEGRPDSTPQGGTTGAPEGTPTGAPEAAPIPEGTPGGPPDDTPGGRP
jgi:hypothetical protein